MKLRLPGASRLEGKTALDAELSEFSDLLGATVVESTAVAPFARARTGDLAVEVDALSIDEGDGVDDLLELTWEEGIIELVPVRDIQERFGAAARRSDGMIQIPTRQRIGDPTRGVKEVLLEGIKQIRLNVLKSATQQATGAVVANIERKKIPEPGLRRIDGRGRVSEPLKEAPDVKEPLLVLVHGTFSSTQGSFKNLFESTDWEEICKEHADRTFALEHHTLSASPVANAIQLVEALPQGAEIHLLTHSRGGLVGELLCRPRSDRDGDIVATLFGERQYDTLRDELTALEKLRREREIRVKRFARVACPAAGTTLASKRLDRYLSVILTLVGRVAGIGGPAFSFAKALATAIVATRTRADLLPGLEAMMPHVDKGLVPYLSTSKETRGDELAVIAGDLHGGGLGARLKAFFSDLYFWQDNDLVVDSASMFGGVPRVAAKSFYYRAPTADHLSYFVNEPTRACVADFLARGESDRLSSLAEVHRERRGGVPPRARDMPDLPGTPESGAVRPVAILLPGIMGSRLAVGTDQVWVNVWRLAWGGLGKLAIDAEDVTAVGLMEEYYERLYHFLARHYRVAPFPYDWRKPIADSAAELAEQIVEELDAHQQPVRLIAHSMGGLVARTLIANHRSVWDRLVERGGRLLMLGTPNHGSFVPAQAMTEQHRLMKWLNRVDLQHGLSALTDIIRAYPGLVEMLPDALLEEASWASAEAYRPSPEVLSRARTFRHRLAVHGVDHQHMAYVAGTDEHTPATMITEGGRIEFLYTRRGDGTVPWELGQLDRVPMYCVDATHGQIANHTPAFEGFLELLEAGETRKLPRMAPARERDVEREFHEFDDSEREEPVRYYPGSEDLLSTLYGRVRDRDERDVRPVSLSVTNGDAGEALHPILVGHYIGDQLVSVERDLDSRLGGALSRRQRLGVYPGALGSFHTQDSVVIVGLGHVGTLDGPSLRETVSHALLEYALDQLGALSEEETKALHISSVLIGTYGGTRLSIEASMEAMANAIDDVNHRLLDAGVVRVWFASLEFIELFTDIAIEAAHAALRIAERANGRIVAAAQLRRAPGARRSRPHSPYSSGWARRVSIKEVKEKREGETGGAKEVTRKIEFVVSTDLARADPFTRVVQWELVEPMLRAAISTSAEARAVLFQYLLPYQLIDDASQGTDLVLQLNEATARVPWELIGPVQERLEPCGVRAGMLRQLDVQDGRLNPKRSQRRRALVIGDPKDAEPRLEGAAKEAEAVAAHLKEQGFHVGDALVNSSPSEIIQALYSDEYDILHIAAHGEFDPENREAAGVVLDETKRITSDEFENLVAVPSIVFLNCCHLGKMDSLRVRDPGQLAASVAQHLMKMGVRVVVAAGWAVDDVSAITFATEFYDALSQGKPLIEVVKHARQATYRAGRAGDVTWGAYQVYGDPGFVLPHADSRDPISHWSPEFVAAEEVVDYVLDFESRARRQGANIPELRARLGQLAHDLPAEWAQRGDVCHALGAAYASLNARREAIRWYERAATRSDAPFRAVEQLANLLAREAVAAQDLERFGASQDRLRSLSQAAGESLERHALRGATLRRLASVQKKNGDEGWRDTVRNAVDAYRAAMRAEPNAPNLYYPAVNIVALQLDEGSPDAEALLDQALQNAQLALGTDPWARIAAADVALLRYAASGDGSPEQLADAYVQAARGGAGAKPLERDSVLHQVRNVAELVTNDEVAERLRAVQNALEQRVFLK